MFSNSLACKSDNKYISLYDIGADVYPLLLTYEKTTEGELFFNNLDVISPFASIAIIKKDKG
jgi:hypothetical protein